MKKHKLTIKLGLLISATIITIKANIYDTNHPTVIESNYQGSQSCFGYSLDFAQDNNGQNWLFVGAPKAVRKNEIRGAVSACKMDKYGSNINCQDREPDLSSDTNENPIYEDQMLGITVVTAKHGPRQDVRMIF